ncbi:MAG TPA: helix-turn-helix transcriptional regulator [Streptosporangiaceae bacterium]|nr:helix-turn-helix transcriptional regulator [Streptosporangiaceae bacterium]
MGKSGDHNGQRLARARLRRRWTQERLARESGFSLATVRAIEQGRRSLDNMGQLLTFARALEVPVTDLTGQPYTASSPEQDAGQGAVAGIRRELLLAEREPRISDAQAAAISVPLLRRRVEDMAGRHRSAALASMGHDLPDLLRDLRAARHAVLAAQRATVYGLLAQAYEAAMDMLKQTGYVADATSAIERARSAAQRSGDPLRALTVEWHYSGEFIRVGELGDAADIIEGGLRELRPLAREDVTVAALTGAYELKAALVAARAGDEAAMWQRWERAYAVGEELGRDLNEPLAFGPSNVAIWSVALPVEMLDGAEAVARARQVNPVLGALVPAATIAKGRYSRERLSRHWIDVGRAYHYRADRDHALSSILQAERIAPHKTRINPAAREVVSHLLRSRGKNDLVELALRMGVA